MVWWMWVVAGLALLGLEMLTPGGFVFLFIGVAGVVAGVVTAAAPDLAPWAQFLVFSCLAITSLLLFRGPLLRRIHPTDRVPPPKMDSIVGEIALPRETLAPGATGQVELRGTVWTARNEGDVPLAIGTRCVVVRVDGLTLGVRAE